MNKLKNKIQNYINDYVFCSEYLFKDWESFLDLLYTEGGCISSILWRDHCRKSQLCESVGSGGFKDPENDKFIYAETQLSKEDLETYTLDEIKDYINQERKQVSGMAANTGAIILCLLSIWQIDDFITRT